MVASNATGLEGLAILIGGMSEISKRFYENPEGPVERRFIVTNMSNASFGTSAPRERKPKTVRISREERQRILDEKFFRDPLFG